MRAFDLVTATSARHAVELLAAHGPSVRVLAGGTDLLADLKSAGATPATIVDISRAEDLKGISLDEDGLRIGALVTHGEIVDSPLVRDTLPALADAAHSIGALQTRNMGTIGGNLMTCVPSMDSGPLLLALDACVTVANADGLRRLPLAELFVGPRRTSLRYDELLIEIVIPVRHVGKSAAFMKFGLRKGQALALVNVAATLRLDGGRIREPTIALGAVAPTVMRARQAEDSLQGNLPAAASFVAAGRLAASEATPITDFRASAEYRRDLVAVLTARCLQAAYALAVRPKEHAA